MPASLFKSVSVAGPGGYVLAVVLALLGGCGGSTNGSAGDSSPVVASAVGATRSTASPELRFEPDGSGPPSQQTLALQEEGGRLNAKELDDIRQKATLPARSGGPSLTGLEAKVLTKAVAAVTRTPAYRFYNTRTSAHFYTVSEAERDQVIRELPFMSFEGPAFEVSASELSVLSPVYRFYNRQTGVHFYTISEAEKAHIIAKLPQFTFEGIAYHASVLEGPGYTPLYRFFLKDKGYHFYTASAEERDRIQRTLPQYVYEGIGYYVLTADWVQPRLRSTFQGTGECYGAGSDTLLLTPCYLPGSAGMALYPAQDAMRRDRANDRLIPRGRFERFPSGLHNECVFDPVSGLTWETKVEPQNEHETGLRLVTNRYSNSGNGAVTDVSGYIAAINANQLCGHNDWRLPSLQELHTLLEFEMGLDAINEVGGYGYHSVAPAANGTPGRFIVAGTLHWTSAKRGGINNYVLNFGNSSRDTQWYGGTSAAVLLVRGAVWGGSRYLVTTRPFRKDVANNAVLDRKTGLVWRRCLGSMEWTGQGCAGSVTWLTHEQALDAARPVLQETGWRMPDVRESYSLFDESPGAPSSLDPGLFPPLPGGYHWSTWTTTPNTKDSGRAFHTDADPASPTEPGDIAKVTVWGRSNPIGTVRYVWGGR